MTGAVLFDLDGTLVDTAPDLGYALNVLLERHHREKLSDAKIRPYASHGTRGLLGLGFGITPQDAHFAALRDEYLDIYDQVFTRSPVLFDGMAEVLRRIEERDLLWGIVTNKPRRFTQRLVLAMELRPACLVSGDDAPQPKPSPDTLLMACEQIGTTPRDCIYIGDAERDIQAGKAAGMRTAVALFGYIDENDKPEEWGADSMVYSPQGILSLL